MSSLAIKSLLNKYTLKLVNGNFSYIEILKLYIKKEKNIYQTLNLLKTQGQIFHGNCWCPVEKEKKIMQILQFIQNKNRNIATAQINQMEKNAKLQGKKDL